MRIPHFQKLRSEQLDNLRVKFVRAHANTFIHPKQALEFITTQLSHLPSTEQTAITKQLIKNADTLVRWPPNRDRLPPAQQRERELLMLDVLQQFVSDSRADSLGVDDLAKELALNRQNPI